MVAGWLFWWRAGVLGVYGWLYGQWKPLLLYTASFVLLFVLVILPFLSHGFGYWFNHGQAPHSSRVSGFDIATEFFGASQWIKFYLFLLVLLVAGAVSQYWDVEGRSAGGAAAGADAGDTGGGGGIAGNELYAAG